MNEPAGPEPSSSYGRSVTVDWDRVAIERSRMRAELERIFGRALDEIDAGWLAQQADRMEFELSKLQERLDLEQRHALSQEVQSLLDRFRE